MKIGPNIFRLLTAMAPFIMAAIFVHGQQTAATPSAPKGLSPAEKRGKQIYLKGESGGEEMVASLGSDELEVPAASFACVNCHGLRGEGTKEGGLQPPPINWETLTKPHTSALTRRERAAYTEATLSRAIAAGVDPANGPLHPGMPRYRMTTAQMADLIAYLKQLGKESDAEPGITEETIKFGAALPMSGPLAAVGEDVRATLAASFAQINSQGGIYGRRLELTVADSRGDAAGTVEATRRLIEQDEVFALISSFEPGESSAVNELLKSHEVPLVGPVTLSPRLTVPPNPYIFYLLPTFADQTRCLVDFIATKSAGKKPRLGVLYARGAFNQDALAGLKTQAALYSMEIASEQSYDAGRLQPAATVALLVQKKPDYLFFFGGADEFTTLASEMERAKLNIPLLSSVVMIGRAAFSLPKGVAAQTFLAYPAAIPKGEDFAEFVGLMQKAGVRVRYPAFQSLAFASTRIFVEAIKSSGRQLDRKTLLGSLEQLRDFQTGVVPPVTFGPNRRVGSTGSHIVGIDSDNKQYVPLTDRLLPKERL